MTSSNILIIVIDALRADRVLNRQKTVNIPEIDQFAKEACVFSNAFSTTNTTDPAVTSIQTGRYPLSHGIINHGNRITNKEKQAIEQVEDLPMMLSDIGYRTGKFGRPLGRWHRRGFDIYPDPMEEGLAFDRTLSRKEKFQAWLTHIESSVGSSLDRIHPGIKTTMSDIYHKLTPEFLSQNHIRASIADNSSNQVLQNFQDFVQKEDPFYAFVHLMDTHTPYVAAADRVVSLLKENEYSVKRISGIEDKIPSSFTERIFSGSYPEIREKYYFPDGTPSSAIVDAHYDATVEQSDARIGRILDTLKNNDLYDDTITFILSDHGESLTEHGIYYDHHGLYDETTHVPLFIRSPEGVSDTVNELVQITDIAPTIESYIGAERLNTDGNSLLPAITGGQFTGYQHILAEEAHTTRRRVIRSDESKLIYSLNSETICRYCGIQHAQETELYNLTEDSGETTNIAAENSEEIDSLREFAEKKATKYQNDCPTTTSSEEKQYDDEEKIHEHLEALGYR